MAGRKGPETLLVAAIRKEIESAYPNSWVVKISGGPYQTSGIPDLLCVVQGVFIGLEVKAVRPGETEEHAANRLTLRQEAVIGKINAAGGSAYLVLSVDDAMRAVRAALAERG